MIILGINAYHADAAACILRDGVLLAAAEEERFRRLKHWAGFPSRAIAYCLAEAKVDLGDVACVAVNSRLYSSRRFSRARSATDVLTSDVPALVSAIVAVGRYAEANLDSLVELDVNPVIVRPAGAGAVAVDALIRLA